MSNSILEFGHLIVALGLLVAARYALPLMWRMVMSVRDGHVDWKLARARPASGTKDDGSGYLNTVRLGHSTWRLTAASPTTGKDASLFTSSRAKPSRVKDPVPAVGEHRTRIYTVQLGDTLRVIAHDWLGDSQRWSEILGLNKVTIQDQNLLVPGTVLLLPLRKDARRAA